MERIVLESALSAGKPILGLCRGIQFINAALGGALYLVYTRAAGFNDKVVRFRSPLFLAEIDPERLCLRRDTEQTVFPLHGDPEKPESVGLLGNFMVTVRDEGHALVTDGEIFPGLGYDRPGNLRLARVEA